MIVTSIQQLIDRYLCFDQELEALYACLLITHPVIATIAPGPTNRVSHGDKCVDCDDPIIQCWSRVDDMLIPICKGCVIAVKLKSARHQLASDEVCLDCHITMDDNGYPRQIYHQSKRRGPTLNPDGVVTDNGLDADIAAGAVVIDDTSGMVSINGEIIKSKRRQPSRSWRAFFHTPVEVNGEIITSDMIGPTADELERT